MARSRTGVITPGWPWLVATDGQRVTLPPAVLEFRRTSPLSHNMSARRVPLTKQMPILKPEAQLYELKLRN